MVRHAAAILALLVTAASPAVADPQSEAMLREVVDNLDALPDWSAAVGAIRSEGDNTIAEGLRITRTEPRIEVEVERLRFLDLSAREGSGFVASEIELTNGALRSDPVDYRIPSALATSIAMPSFADVSFDTRHLMTALAKIYAAAAEGELAELGIPEVHAVQRQTATGGTAPAETRILYREVVSSGLRGGTLRSQTIGPLSVSGTNAEGEAVEFGIDSVAAENIDLDAVAHIFDPDRYRERRGDGVWRPLISRIAYSGISATGPRGADMRLESLALENVDGRQPRKPMTAMWDRMLDPAVPQEVKSELALEAVQSMLEAWRLGTFRLQGLAVDAPSDNTQFSLDTLTVSGLSEEGIDSVLLKALRGASPQGFASLDSFELAGLLFPDFDALMKFAALEKDLDPAEHAEIVRSSFAALPRLSRIALNGLKAGLSEADAVSVGAFSLDFSDWNEVFAGASEIRLESVAVPRSLMQLDVETAKIMDTLALDPLVFGLSLSNRWSPEAGTDQGTWTFSLQDAADVEFSYTLAGLTMDWMTSAIAAAGKSEDSEAALIAMYSDLALQSARVAVTDRSLLDRAFAVAAQKQNLTVDGPAYRAQMRGALPFLLSAATPPEISKLLTEPMQAFMEGGQTLIAEIAPPAPIPLPELVAAASRDPMQLPSFLGLTLRSEEPAQ